MEEEAHNEEVHVAVRPAEPARSAVFALDPRSARQLVGQMLGPFRIEQHLGSGGMGAVYCATDERLGRKVAVKLLPRGGARIESLLGEARAAATIDHPNAVKIYDVSEIDGTPCLVMELVYGRTLRAFVADSSISARQKINWLIDVAKALAVAHAKGVIHQDVKPDNVMFGDDGVVKVLDFGIARRLVEVAVATGGPGRAAASTITQTSWEIRGTAVYMAPERLSGEVGDAHSDQFAWGVFAYELLSGRLPWSMRGGMAQLVDDIRKCAPAPLFGRCPGVSREVDAIVARAMAKRPARRFPSMVDVVRALSLANRVVAPAQEDAPVGWRRRVFASSAGALAIVALGAALCGDATAHVAEAMAPPAEQPPLFAAPPDYGSTMPPNAEAVEEYRQGIQAMRNAAGSSARYHLDRAIAIVPSFAAAICARS